MKKTKYSRDVKEMKIPRYKYFIAIMISLFILILPFISRLKIMNLPTDTQNVFTNNNGIYIDLFLYYKEVFIICFGVFLILFFLGERIFPDNKINFPLKEKRNRKIILCIGIYVVTVIVSYLFSDYKQLSLMGSPTECEGIFVLITYSILFLAGINYFNYKKSINILRRVIIVLTSIVVILTFVEFLYKPLFEIPLFRSFLANREYSTLVASIQNIDYQGMVSLTLYNPNYFGALCVILFPISFSMFINENNNRMKTYLGILSVGMLFCGIASKSTASIYIVLLEIILISIYFRNIIIRNIKENSIYLALALAVLIFINVVSNDKLAEVFRDGLVNSPSVVNNKEKFILNDINMNGEVLEIKGNNNSIIIEIDNNTEEKLRFFDENNIKIESTIIDNCITFNDERFNNINIKYLGYGIVIDIGYNDTMEFYITADGFKGVGQNGAKIDNIKRQNTIMSSIYPIATGRGYAWVNTIPLLKNSLIWGTGPGTFAMYFQQNDYVGLMNTHGSAKFVIDKPHNMYLQIAQQTGGLGLIALCVIFVVAIISSVKLYFNSDYYNKDVQGNNSELNLGFGIFVGLVAFLLISLVNDSIVTVKPIFWVLLGVNFSIIQYLKINKCVE